MTTTNVPSDPLASSLAVLLKWPLTELYALLWRAGVLEIVSSERTGSNLAVPHAEVPTRQFATTARGA